MIALSKIKKFLNSKSSSIISGAAIISIASLASRLLGVVRDRVLASQFGAGAELDMYYAAFRVPDLIYNLVILGALSAGFIPVFTSLLKKHDKEGYESNKDAWDLVNNVLNTVLIFLTVACGILFIATPWLMKYIAPGFNGEQLQVTVNLTRIMFLSPIFLGISGIFGGVLQSFKRFLLFSLAPIMYNLGIILGAFFIVDYVGIYGLAIGVVLGAFLHMILQLPVAIDLGFRYRPVFQLRNKNIRKIGRMMIPRTMGLATAQLNLIVVTILGSTLTAGSITIYNFATNLQSFPIGLFGIAFSLAAFPAMSIAFAKKNMGDFKNSLETTLRQILLFTVPFTIIFILLRIQIVRIVLGAGQFGWTETILTADVLGVFALSLFAQSLIPLLARAYYAMQNTMVPFIISLISMTINIALSLLLVENYGVMGLSFAFTVSNVVNFALLFVFLRSRVGDFGIKRIAASLGKMSLAAIGMAIAIQLSKEILGRVVDMQKFWGIFIQGAVAGSVGLACFVLISYLLKSEEMLRLKDGLARRLWRRKGKLDIAEESIREAGQ
ncbi:MAG TPA: murein biosynthesis integral membrane protein MurJ [Candidatus Bipolaricaulota bacterium]|nr:murein biosynthesis integral membrane protein MurJ [Candidatus Bipolaricaulota bacterium]